jgi:hypothetical protein
MYSLLPLSLLHRTVLIYIPFLFHMFVYEQVKGRVEGEPKT